MLGVSLDKEIKIILFFISFSLIFYISANVVYAAECGGSISCSCGDTLNESRTLNASDSLTGCPDTGLIINGTGITLDCAGYVINGSGGSSTIGVKINYGSDNTIVKNCKIHSFGTGIYGNASFGMNITNNTIYNLSNYNGAGIDISDASQTRGVTANITNNNITSEKGSGIFCSVGIANVINNSISGYDYGIESGFQGNWGQIKGNNITASYNLSGNVVFINSGSPNITENKITGGYIGIYLYTYGFPKVWHNNIYNQSSYKVYSQYPITLFYNNEGNYWGRDSCPVFMPMLDSNTFYVMDIYAYKTLNGWLTESPVDCPPMSANPSNVTPTNYSYTTYSQFNITWGDELGVDKVFITIMNSTEVLINNASMTNTSGFSTYDYFVVLPAGTFNWTSYANDSAGNWSKSDIWTFTINKGTLDLSISFSPSNTVFYPTQTTALGNENNEGDGDVIYELRRGYTLVDNIKPYQEIITLAIGTYNYTFNATGGQNWTVNSVGVSALLTIQQQPATIPDIGRFYIPEVSVTKAKGKLNITIKSTEAGKITNVTITKTEDIAFRKIDISIANVANYVKIKIQKLAGLPASVTHEIEGKVYHYIEITKQNITDTDINKVYINFAVNRSWLDVNNINYNNITLYRWANNVWNALKTILIVETATEALYSAESPGLSYFAIGTTQAQAPPEEEIIITCEESWSCTDWGQCVDRTQRRICTDSNSCGTTFNKPAESRMCAVGAEVVGFPVFEIVIVIILIVVVVLLILKMKGKISFDFLNKIFKREWKYEYKPKQ